MSLRAIVRSIRYDQPPAWVLHGLARAALSATGRRRDHAGRPARLLVVRNDQLGDAVLTIPLLRALRRNLPDTTIGLLTSRLAGELFEACPYVDELYIQPARPVFQPLLRLTHVWAMSRRVFGRAQFDTALLPRWDQDGDGGVLMAYFSGASRRIGYGSCANPAEYPKNHGLARFLTRCIDDQRVRHEVQRALDVLEPLGLRSDDTGLELWPSPDDAAWATSFLRALGLPAGMPLVALGIGGADPRRIWPRDRLVSLARAMRRDRPYGFVVIGGAREAREGGAVARAIGDHAVSVCATLNQLACLLRAVRLYVGNDTGVMHMAAAVRVPCVVISCHPTGAPAAHSNAPERFHPWGVPYAYARPTPRSPECATGCRDTGAHCILNVDVESVWSLTRALTPADEPPG